ncbi:MULTISPECIES: ThuA domain-containing protein [unclassified Microbacterium]|uniref:ThuA domain-containing protein n=1 Tax=unclassified Microbacterium TaxID=2609290 RepID=UPI00386938FA
MRALIASGTGRYADPWHPFPQTTPLIAEVLDGAGFDVTVSDHVDDAMRSLSDVDLLVVNAGDPWRAEGGEASAPSASIDGFAEALGRGLGVLAFHCAVASLRDYPEWAPAVGGMWVPGLSFHPPFGLVDVTGLAVPGGKVIGDFTVEDERYCRIQRIGRSQTVAQFEGPDATEPAAWVREAGASRVAVDVLGHDERSYASPGHRRLIGQLARWTVGADD